MQGIGHRQRQPPDASCRGDRLLGDHPTSRPGCPAHALEHHSGVDHVEEQEPAECEVDWLGKEKILAGLGDGYDLAECGGSRRDLVTGPRVAVDRVDTSGVTDDLSKGHRDVTASRTYVDAAPSRSDAEALECSGQWPPVDVVAQRVHAR